MTYPLFTTAASLSDEDLSAAPADPDRFCFRVI